MKSMALLSAVLAAAGVAAPAWAVEVRDHPKAVLELFTSQGCSSCPMADAKLGDLCKSPDLITLAYHVDYWDYIGWVDTFGSKANSDLQKSYAQSWGSSRIYTPELVVTGNKGVVGSRQKEVDGALGLPPLGIPVVLNLGDKMLDVTVGPQAGGVPAVVWLVTFLDHAQVVIDRGENAGKTIDYTQIVTSRQMRGLWDPASGLHVKLPLSELEANGG